MSDRRIRQELASLRKSLAKSMKNPDDPLYEFVQGCIEVGITEPNDIFGARIDFCVRALIDQGRPDQAVRLINCARQITHER